MLKALTLTCAVTASGLVLAGAALAADDAAWTFEKLSVTPRPGWCPARVGQALEIRPCGEDFPNFSIAIKQRNAARQDLAKLAAAEAASAGGDDNKKHVMETIEARAGRDCEDNSFAIQPSPVPGVPGFVVAASYICPPNEDQPALFNIFTAYAQSRDGSIWVLSFDHPGTPLSDPDRAMIRAVIAKITKVPPQ